MSGFTSIYRKDYLWPPRKPYFPRADLTCVVAGPIYEDDPEASDGQPEKVKLRLQPCPKPEKLQVDPTDACLKQLLDDKPNLLEITPKKPCSASIKKFNLERLLSTYQVDYDHMRDKIMPKSEIKSEAKKPCPSGKAGPVECRVGLTGRAELMRNRRNTYKDPCKTKTSCTLPPPKKRKPKEVPLYLQRQIPAWTSEYREEINRTGMEIARELGMSKRKRQMLALNKLLKPKLICNNDEGNGDDNNE